MPVYDDLRDREEQSVSGQNPTDDDLRKITGITPEEEDLYEKTARNKQESTDTQPSDAKDAANVATGAMALGKLSGAGAVLSFVKNRKKRFLLGGGTLSIVALVAILSLGAFAPFKLTTLMKSVEQTSFARFNAINDERSSKWLQAYFTARTLEVSGKATDGRPANLLDETIFKADKVDNNNMFTDWYRTLRASSFERDLFLKHGIKFTSIAYQDGNMIKFRPAKITINASELKINPPKGVSSDVIEKAINGDVSAINQINALSEDVDTYIQKQVFAGDWEGRAAMRTMLRDELPGARNLVKRWHVRKDIQNTTGTRSWQFFEKTQQKAKEGAISVRNKLIAKSIPDNLKAGRYVQCFFGIKPCKGSTDVASPEFRELNGVVDGTPGKDVVSEDGAGVSKADNGITQQAAEEAATKLGEEAGSEGIQKAMLKEVISKISGPVGVISTLDSVARVDDMMGKGVLTTLVSNARATQSAALYATMSTATSQLATGKDVTGSEVSNLANIFKTAENSEAWSNVISPGGSRNTGNTAAKNALCQEKTEAELQKQTYFPYCDQYKIGGPSTAATIQNGWNTVFGPFRSIFQVYLSSGGKVFDVFGSVVGFLGKPLEAALSQTLTAIGLQAKIDQIVTWLGGKALVLLGAGPMFNGTEPGGVLMNSVLAGAAFQAESSMRYQGAASTNAASRETALLTYNTMQSQAAEDATTYDRYFDIHNTASVANKVAFRLSSTSTDDASNALMTSLAKMPTMVASLFTHKAHAATSRDPYAAAKFAGIETYDYPPDCGSINPMRTKPSSNTNADELGLIPSSELTWELVSNKDKFYERLYKSAGDDEKKAKQVWNCALLDNAVATGLGASYGYKGEAVYSSGGNGTRTTFGSSKIIEGDTTNIPCGAGSDLGIAEGWNDNKRYMIRLCNVYGIDINSQIAAKVDAMITDAQKDDITLRGGGYRTNDEQIALRKKNGCPDVNTAPSSSCATPTARPGESNHQMGFAIDFAKDGSAIRSGSPEFRWLKSNAADYGLQNLPSEPWHWSVDGT